MDYPDHRTMQSLLAIAHGLAADFRPDGSVDVRVAETGWWGVRPGELTELVKRGWVESYPGAYVAATEAGRYWLRRYVKGHGRTARDARNL